MDMVTELHNVESPITAVMLFEKESELDVNHFPPTLEDIQRRARRIHYEHGAVTGGYTLDDWLEAEHELLDHVDAPSDESEHLH